MIDCEHRVPIDRIESFLEVDKCDEERVGVNVRAIHDALQDMNLKDAASTSTEAGSYEAMSQSGVGYGSRGRGCRL